MRTHKPSTKVSLQVTDRQQQSKSRELEGFSVDSGIVENKRGMLKYGRRKRERHSSDDCNKTTLRLDVASRFLDILMEKLKHGRVQVNEGWGLGGADVTEEGRAEHAGLTGADFMGTHAAGWRETP